MTDDSYRGRRVLVTGAGGFIGHHLVRRLVRAGARVRAMVRYNAGADWGLIEMLEPDVRAALEVFAGDVTDPTRTAQALADCEIVLHLAALISIPYSYQTRYSFTQVNVLGTQHVLEAALVTRPARLIVTSTSEVYGSAQREPMDEDHPLHPQSPYAASKVAADALALAYQAGFDLPVALVRPFNVFGPGQSARSVIPAMVVQALERDALELGALETVRDFTYVDDTVEAFLRAGLAAAPGRVYNVGTGAAHRIGEALERVGTILGKRLTAATAPERLRPAAGEVTRLVCDATRARRELGWAPAVSFDDGLRRTIDWIRAHAARYKQDRFNY
jgi:nucleoside-diphosphate-sugar epimerase